MSIDFFWGYDPAQSHRLIEPIDLGLDGEPVPSSVPAAEASLVVARLVAERDEWKETAALHAGNAANARADAASHFRSWHHGLGIIGKQAERIAYLENQAEVERELRAKLEETHGQLHAEVDRLKAQPTYVTKWAVRDSSDGCWLVDAHNFTEGRKEGRGLFESKTAARYVLSAWDGPRGKYRRDRGKATFVKVRVKG